MHPRCRCSISYDEIETPRALRPKSRGLAAGNAIYFNEGSKPPYKIGDVDFYDNALVGRTLSWFESLAVNAPIENALIITASGEVYHCTGDLNTLETIEELGQKLRGAIVTHNHPVGSANEYSFSEDDIKLFRDFDLKILRGVDEKFIYELNRNPFDKETIQPFIVVARMPVKVPTTMDNKKFLRVRCFSAVLFSSRRRCQFCKSERPLSVRL